MRLDDVISSDMTLTHDLDGTRRFATVAGACCAPDVVMCHTGDGKTRRSSPRHASGPSVAIVLPDEHQCARVSLG